MALASGSIAFVGYNADGNDNLAFVVLEPVLAGSVITFTDNAWDGASFSSGEATWTWTAASDLAAGTIVTMDGLAAGQTATSNLGTIDFLSAAQGVDDADEAIYAYTGDASAPNFLAAIANDTFENAGGTLNGTGLAVGDTAIQLAGKDADADIAQYNGPRSTISDFAVYRQHINNPQNWITQDTAADNSNDSGQPNTPFSEVPLTTTSDLGAGSIAFIGAYDTSREGDIPGDMLTFVTLDDIAAGTVIQLSTKPWTGSEFNDSFASGAHWTWTAGEDIAAGTVVTMEMLNTGEPTSNLGEIDVIGADVMDYRGANAVYAYLGETGDPTTFLTAFTTYVWSPSRANINGTGLTDGVDALSLGGEAAIAAFNGIRSGQESFDDYLAVINNRANWDKELFGVDISNNGRAPDLPLSILPFVDASRQAVGFAADSLAVSQSEGDSDAVAFTFVVERTGGTTGTIEFSGQVVVPGTPSGTEAGANDFAAPVTFTGIIADGESSTTVTIMVSGDSHFEQDERFVLELLSFTHSDGGVVGTGVITATGTILNDDSQPDTVAAGETATGPFALSGVAHLTVEDGGAIDVTGNAITLSGTGSDIVVDNHGLIRASDRAMSTTNNADGAFTLNNSETGIVEGELGGSGRLTAASTVTINNSGVIRADGRVIDYHDAVKNGAKVTINNLEGGLIEQSGGGSTDMIRPGANTKINNWGTIMAQEGHVGGGDLIDYQDNIGGEVHNYGSGWLEGARHAVTGDRSIDVTNEGTMIGRNGSAVNIDNNGTEAERVFVTNRGRMEGRSANLSDSDGDAVDIDGLLTLDNYGFIGGMGHNGRHDGEPNVSEGVAIGGGMITNHAGGEIYGYGRAIQVDNSSNANALGTTTIVNHGLIRGDGNAPTGVTPEEQALFAERIRGGEAINLLGNYGDEIENTGQIVGGVKMGGGDDIVANQGTMTATGGSAVDLGDGDDTFEAHAGSTVDGLIDGGEGNDTLELIGPGIGSLGANANFETLDVQSGMWTLQSDAYDSVKVATGATVMSQLRLAEQGQLAVAVGAMVLVASGSDAVAAEGSADIENAGLIQALGMDGTTPARAVVSNGGEVHNKAGGTILAQGTAIASGDAAVAGLDIVNEGMVQSLSGQAVALAGEQDDSLTNKGMIMGDVDLGAGDDALDVHTGSSISGAMEGGEGDDTVSLIGATAASVGTFAATTGFENLVVQEGTWSVANSESYDAITIEDGATVTSGLVVSGDDHVVVEAGGALDVTDDAIFWQGYGIDGDIVVDNAGLIESDGRVFNTQVNSSGNFTFNNLEGGVVRGSFDPRQEVRPDSVVTFNNAGVIENDGRVFDFKELTKDGAQAIINNLEGGIIRQTANGGSDVARFDDNTVVNNWGTIISEEGAVGGGDALDFDSGRGSSVHNYAGGLIEGARHAVTGKQDFTIVNDGTMIGRNGSAVNFDTKEDELVTITNRGIMEGRSAELSDSDGDAVDVDGLVYLLNYGSISGLGAEGYHDGEPNVSEGLAIGGGTILNYGTDAVIYGYGRAIQVDNSSNANALGATFINNEGLIQGDGHGPEGVDPEDAAVFDLRGNEAINLVGEHNDEIINQSTGRIVGGISMGGGNDRLNNSGSIVATGGSAIDMGAGDDWVNLYPLGAVSGKILLGTGNDFLSSTTDGGFDVDGGEGDDQMYMSATIYGGDDILSGGAGNDTIYAGLGDDRIDGGLDNDILFGDAGNDVIEGGEGDDGINGGTGNDILFGDAGNDRLVGGLGNDTVNGNAGDDIFVVTSLDDGRDSYDGGDGVDTLDFSAVTTAVNLNLKDDAASKFATDTIENIENVIGGAAADKLTGNSLANVLIGNDGNDIIKGAAGDDMLDGGDGHDELNGGADNDQLIGGLGNDLLKGAAGDDMLDGGEGDDELIGGAGNDILVGGAGDDWLTAGAGDDEIDGGEGDDYLDAGAGNDIIIAGAGNDTIVSGAGNDRIEGGAGNDLLSSLAGNDTFVFAAGFGHDTVHDFRTNGGNADLLEFSSDLFADFDAVMASASQIGTDTVIAFDPDNTLTLQGVRLTNLQADDFLFV